MHHNLENQRKHLTLATAFFAKYGELLPNCGQLSYSQCDFYDDHMTDVAKVFGKSGWTRHLGYSGKFDWHKVVDGITVIINGAEPNEFNNSPVPEKSWPVLLEDSAKSVEAVPREIYSAFEQYDTSAT